MFQRTREHRNSGRRKVNAPTILHEIYARDGCISGTLNTATWLRAECSSGFAHRDLSLHAHAFACSVSVLHRRAGKSLPYTCNVNASLRRSQGKWKREISGSSLYTLIALYSPRGRNQAHSELDRVSYVSVADLVAFAVSQENQWSEFFVGIARDKIVELL